MSDTSRTPVTSLVAAGASGRSGEVPVKKSPSRLEGVRSGLAEHFELFLTAAGVCMAIGLSFADLSRGEQGVAHAFLVWVQGFLLWAVHRHGWFRRRALVEKMRLMLQDRVNNQLTVMLGMAEIRDRPRTPMEEQDLETATAAARTVAHELETLSLESISSWERRYGYLLRRRFR
jgi:hypothetical protein